MCIFSINYLIIDSSLTELSLLINNIELLN